MNKNSKKKKMNRDFRKACRVGHGSEEKVISSNFRRNMEQRVIRWVDAESGKKQTRTVHCKMNPARPSFPKPRRDGLVTPAPAAPTAPAEIG